MKDEISNAFKAVIEYVIKSKFKQYDDIQRNALKALVASISNTKIINYDDIDEHLSRYINSCNCKKKLISFYVLIAIFIPVAVLFLCIFYYSTDYIIKNRYIDITKSIVDSETKRNELYKALLKNPDDFIKQLKTEGQTLLEPEDLITLIGDTTTTELQRLYEALLKNPSKFIPLLKTGGQTLLGPEDLIRLTKTIIDSSNQRKQFYEVLFTTNVSQLLDLLDQTHREQLSLIINYNVSTRRVEEMNRLMKGYRIDGLFIERVGEKIDGGATPRGSFSNREKMAIIALPVTISDDLPGLFKVMIENIDAWKPSRYKAEMTIGLSNNKNVKMVELVDIEVRNNISKPTLRVSDMIADELGMPNQVPNGYLLFTNFEP